MMNNLSPTHQLSLTLLAGLLLGATLSYTYTSLSRPSYRTTSRRSKKGRVSRTGSIYGPGGAINIVRQGTSAYEDYEFIDGDSSDSDDSNLENVGNNRRWGGRSKQQHKKMKEDIKVGLEGVIGNTPLMKIKSLSKELGCEVLAKCEVYT